MMKITIDILELVDLQSALRRAEHYTNEVLSWAEDRNLPKSVEIYKLDLERYSALSKKLEAAFDEAYPPPAEEIAA